MRTCFGEVRLVDAAGEEEEAQREEEEDCLGTARPASGPDATALMQSKTRSSCPLFSQCWRWRNKNAGCRVGGDGQNAFLSSKGKCCCC